VTAAFSSLSHNHIDALMITPSVFFFSRRAQIIQLAATYGVPPAYWLREFPEAGGLMSYRSSILEMHRQVGSYVGRILHGAKPADPVRRREFVAGLAGTPAWSVDALNIGRASVYSRARFQPRATIRLPSGSRQSSSTRQQSFRSSEAPVHILGPGPSFFAACGRTADTVKQWWPASTSRSSLAREHAVARRAVPRTRRGSQEW
jgi:hypothetical protein